MRSLILAAVATTLVPSALFVAPTAAQAHDWRYERDWRAERHYRHERWREAHRDPYWRDGWAYRHRHYDRYREYGWRDDYPRYRW